MNKPATLTIPAVAALLLLTAQGLSLAGSATWNADPIDGDWSKATNWTPNTVPMALPDTATFGVSNETNISIDIPIVLLDLTINSGASNYTFTPQGGGAVVSIHGGIFNNSDVEQDFVTTISNRGLITSFAFFESASVGPNCVFTGVSGATNTGAAVSFNDDSSAGEGIFNNEGGALAGDNVGHTDFYDRSTGGNATCISNGGLSDGATGGATNLFPHSTAGNGTFISNGGLSAGADGGTTVFAGGGGGTATVIANGATVEGAHGGAIVFFGTSHASSATLIVNDGSNGGEPATLSFLENSYGDQASVKVYGAGTVTDATYHLFSFTIGSLEGDGVVVMFTSHTFNIGSNNRSTTFSGLIQGHNLSTDALAKVGTGTLTLAGANDYAGTTTVSGGALRVANTTGSATGTSAVTVPNATLGGSGIIAGAATIGSGGGTGAFLAPALGTKKQGRLRSKAPSPLTPTRPTPTPSKPRRVRPEQIRWSPMESRLTARS